MGFRCRWGVELLCVLLWGISLPAMSDEGSHVTVLVSNSAEVAPALLREAEGEASRLFRAAGIEIQWVNCRKGTRDECRVVGYDEYVLHIVQDGKTTTKSVFGEAFLGEGGIGKYSDVFFRRIQSANRTFGADPAQLLGAVSAHELGHLLLGSQAHSRMGIMEPIWQQESLRRIGMGTLLFTPKQAQVMKRRIGERTWSASSVSRRGKVPY